MHRWALVLLALVALAPTEAPAQVACSQQSTATLLSQFADTAPNSSITPQNIRNAICSDQQVLAPGASAVVEAPGVSPFTFVAPSAGTLVVSSGQVQVSRNNGGTYYVASLTGGPVALLASDQVIVTWYSAVAPTVTWLPWGQ